MSDIEYPGLGVSVPADEKLAAQLALVFGAAIVLFAPVGYVLKSLCGLSETLFAILVGICFSAGISWFNVESGESQRRTLFNVANVTLGVQVFNIGLRVDRTFFETEWKAVTRLTSCAMIVMWLASSFCVWVVFGYDVLPALVLGGCITPTDPVLASTLVSGEIVLSCTRKGGSRCMIMTENSTLIGSCRGDDE